MAQMAYKSRGFMQTGGLLKAKIRTATESRGFAETRLLTNGKDIAGPSTASLCRPVKVSYGKQGFGATLTFLTTGANAPVLQMQLPKILLKVNSIYGYNAISKIKITQTSPIDFDDNINDLKQKPTKKILSEKQRIHVETSVKSVSDNKLKDALSRLGENIIIRNNKD
jgi:hypothetical protein